MLMPRRVAWRESADFSAGFSNISSFSVEAMHPPIASGMALYTSYISFHQSPDGSLIEASLAMAGVAADRRRRVATPA